MGGFLIGSCQDTTKKAGKMNEFNISQSVDSLSEYFQIPQTSKCNWLIKKRGEASTRVPGPSDYILYAFIRFPDGEVNDRLKTECPSVVELEEGIPVDLQIYSLLGMKDVASGKEYDGKFVLQGPVLNIDNKIKGPFTEGIALIVNPTSLFITAGSF
jgi:hypothetical protein